MATNGVSKGYHTVTPYLVVRDAARVIDFLKKAFDAQETEAFMKEKAQAGSGK